MCKEYMRVATSSEMMLRIRAHQTSEKCWVPHGPDFLWRLVALIHSMRLSLMKGAHADLSCTAWQEIGVKPSVGLSGIMDAYAESSSQ
jgi:hypothetical protein